MNIWDINNMEKDIKTIQLTKATYEKLSSYKRKLSSKMDKDLTFDQVIQIIISNYEK